jgi:hypothetical protein
LAAIIPDEMMRTPSPPVLAIDAQSRVVRIGVARKSTFAVEAFLKLFRLPAAFPWGTKAKRVPIAMKTERVQTILDSLSLVVCKDILDLKYLSITPQKSERLKSRR